jgi:hypothetical protein
VSESLVSGESEVAVVVVWSPVSVAGVSPVDVVAVPVVDSTFELVPVGESSLSRGELSPTSQPAVTQTKIARHCVRDQSLELTTRGYNHQIELPVHKGNDRRLSASTVRMRWLGCKPWLKQAPPPGAGPCASGREARFGANL